MGESFHTRPAHSVASAAKEPAPSEQAPTTDQAIDDLGDRWSGFEFFEVPSVLPLSDQKKRKA
jgi:hypothetical protein